MLSGDSEEFNRSTMLMNFFTGGERVSDITQTVRSIQEKISVLGGEHPSDADIESWIDGDQTPESPAQEAALRAVVQGHITKIPYLFEKTSTEMARLAGHDDDVLSMRYLPPEDTQVFRNVLLGGVVPHQNYRMVVSDVLLRTSLLGEQSLSRRAVRWWLIGKCAPMSPVREAALRSVVGSPLEKVPCLFKETPDQLDKLNNLISQAPSKEVSSLPVSKLSQFEVIVNSSSGMTLKISNIPAGLLGESVSSIISRVLPTPNQGTIEKPEKPEKPETVLNSGLPLTFTSGELSRWKDRLPDVEVAIGIKHLAGWTQGSIAKAMEPSWTQAAVSYRLQRLMTRIDFLRSLPELDMRSFKKDLHFLKPEQIEILRRYYYCNSQSEIARDTNDTQGHIYHSLVRARAQLSARSNTNSKLRLYVTVFEMLWKRPNILSSWNHGDVQKQPLMNVKQKRPGDRGPLTVREAVKIMNIDGVDPEQTLYKRLLKIQHSGVRLSRNNPAPIGDGFSAFKIKRRWFINSP